ncbi:Hsp70 family protein [Aspergillus lucknowensis]|uniref:Uncharacterized protein n=1 Tax=Aspergillus lucknowensis TaxID=176173 RepID=A0ABR4LJW4_9EURO
MSQKLGRSFDDLPRRTTAPGSEFVNKFEIVKRDFGYPSAHRTHELPLNMTLARPDPVYFNEDERLVMILHDDLGFLFDPVVDKVLALVRQQIADANKEARRDAINRIVLVGGFGDSEYLRSAFRKEFGTDGKTAVTIPNNAQAAIVQGATLRGLEGLQAGSRPWCRHYGFQWALPFRKGIDNERDPYVDEFDNKKYCSGHMKWMVTKGQKSQKDFAYEVELSQTYSRRRQTTSGGGQDLDYTVSLYSCDRAETPGRVEHRGLTLIPKLSCVLD